MTQEIGNLRRYCRRCGEFVGRTDEFGLCKVCRREKVRADLMNGEYNRKRHT